MFTHPLFLLITAVLALTAVIITYNKMLALKIRASNAWSDIDVQLKRRYDLVPNLVMVVQAYASHEKSIFEDIARLRSQAMNTSQPAEGASAENQLSSALKTLFAIAENYPELKADKNFLQLQQQLAEIENSIQSARRYYNAVVRDFNTAIQVVPSNVIAMIAGFRKLEYFEAADSERKPVDVDFTEGNA